MITYALTEVSDNSELQYNSTLTRSQGVYHKLEMQLIHKNLEKPKLILSQAALKSKILLNINTNYFYNDCFNAIGLC